MLAMIVGGAGSGKSAYAEKLAVQLAGEAKGPLCYLATMLPGSREADARIARHRKLREGRGFCTIESGIGLHELEVAHYISASERKTEATVLLEDLGNLLGNEMFLPEGGGAEAVLPGIRHVQKQSRHLIVVANEVFSGGSTYEGETEKYLHDLAWIQRKLAEQAELVVEVVCGLPVALRDETGMLTERTCE